MQDLIDLGRVSVVPKGEYNPLTKYERLDLIRYDGAVYLVLRDVSGVIPVDGEDYMLWVESGTSFTVSGRYDTLDALISAHPIGKPGEAYAVGAVESNTIYIWSDDIMQWQNIGSLQGVKGEPGKDGADGKDGVDGANGTVGPVGPAGPGVPTGGTAGQILSKKSSTDYDTQWINQPSAAGDYLPLTGGTLTGNLTLKGSGNYGTKINLGDGDYVHISEPTDDCMEIKAKTVNFVTTGSPALQLNSAALISCGTTDLTAGSSTLKAGTLYGVYEV